MRVLPQGFRASHLYFLLLIFLVIALAGQVSALPADDTPADTDAADPTDDSSTQSASVSQATAITSSTSTSTLSTVSTTTSSSSSSATTTMETTTSSSTSTTSTTSTTSDSSTSTSSVSTTTTSSTSSSSTTAAAIVTIPPIANAPYMQQSSAPEGTVFIAVGAALGVIGLTLLAWRAMVAWSVNRSVRNAAMKHASEKKRLLRGSRKKRPILYSAAPAEISMDKLGAATRGGHKARVSSATSGLFYSPTAGGQTGSHASLNATGGTGNRGSTYLPAGYYAAAGGPNPAGEGPYSSTAGHSSPSLPPVGPHHESYRQSYVGGPSTSSLNLNQPPQGRAPSAYLEDLFENHHHPSHNSDSGPSRR